MTLIVSKQYSNSPQIKINGNYGAENVGTADKVKAKSYYVCQRDLGHSGVIIGLFLNQNLNSKHYHSVLNIGRSIIYC